MTTFTFDSEYCLVTYSDKLCYVEKEKEGKYDVVVNTEIPVRDTLTLPVEVFSIVESFDEKDFARQMLILSQFMENLPEDGEKLVELYNEWLRYTDPLVSFTRACLMVNLNSPIKVESLNEMMSEIRSDEDELTSVFLFTGLLFQFLQSKEDVSLFNTLLKLIPNSHERYRFLRNMSNVYPEIQFRSVFKRESSLSTQVQLIVIVQEYLNAPTPFPDFLIERVVRKLNNGTYMPVRLPYTLSFYSSIASVLGLTEELIEVSKNIDEQCPGIEKTALSFLALIAVLDGKDSWVGYDLEPVTYLSLGGF